MSALNLDSLRPDIRTRIEPFFREILSSHPDGIHALAVTGSAVTPDFEENTSNINSVILLNTMSLDFVRFLAPLGSKYRANRLAAPLVMTAAYAEKSLDVFPVEFLDLKLLHKIVFGADIFGALNIHPEHLRMQCEREIKSRLLALWQGYIVDLGRKDAVTALLIRSVKGMFPLFRGLLLLRDAEPPIARHDVIAAVEKHFPVERDVLEQVLSFSHQKAKLSDDAVYTAFERHYRNLQIISDSIESFSSSTR